MCREPRPDRFKKPPNERAFRFSVLIRDIHAIQRGKKIKYNTTVQLLRHRVYVYWLSVCACVCVYARVRGRHASLYVYNVLQQLGSPQFPLAVHIVLEKRKRKEKKIRENALAIQQTIKAATGPKYKPKPDTNLSLSHVLSLSLVIPATRSFTLFV